MASRDLWTGQLIQCSYAGLRLDVQTTSDANGRVVVTHQLPHREGSPVRDQGAEPRVTRCQIIFFPTDPKDDPRERFSIFLQLANQGKPRKFVHPISGSFYALVGELTWSAAAEPRETIMVECSFHEDAHQPATFDDRGSGMAVNSALAVAEAAVKDFDDGLVEVNAELGEDEEPLTSNLGADVVAQVSGWETAAADMDDPLTARKVNLELVALANKISAETDRLDVYTKPERWPLARALSNLHAAVRRAAATFTEESPRIIEITVTAPTNVYTLAARTYPGDSMDQRADQLLRLNDIRNPARIEAGTRLKAYSRGTSTRLRNPRAFGR
jgi:prophage DNA circulation protein